MDIEGKTLSKVSRRLLPFLTVLYVVAFVDRSAVGVARLTMSADVNISDAAYGLGAGLFFIGYFVFEVPSNIAMHRFGARKWFARILLTWGLITVATAFVSGPTVFYTLRFLLGAAEAGFFPGVIYYLTHWYPQRHRTRALARFILAQPIALLIIGPLGAWAIGINFLDVAGWRWLFVVVGAVAVVLVIPTLLLLPDKPRVAPWLSKNEVVWIETELEKEREELQQTSYRNALKALLDSRVAVLALLYLPATTGTYGISLWLPTLIKSSGVSNVEASALSAVPYVFAIIGILLIVPAKRLFSGPYAPLAMLYAGSAVSIAASVLLTNPNLQMLALCLAAMFMFPITAVFFTIPSRIFTGASAAVAIAMVNSVANLGGFLGPYAVGELAERTGTVAAGMYFLAGCLALGVLITFVAKRHIGMTRPNRSNFG